MKRISTLLLFTFWVLILCAKGMPQLKVSNAALSESDGKLNVSFEVLVPEFGTNYKLIVTPVVYTSLQRQSLPPLVAMGKKKQKLDKRAQPPATSQAAVVVIKRTRSGNSLRYHYTLPYEAWMGRLSLQLECAIEGCCNEQPLPIIQLLADRPIYYPLQPVFNRTPAQPTLSTLQQFDRESPFLYPATDYDRRTTIFEQLREKGALVVNFLQGHSTIDPGYRNNRATLTEVNRTLDLIAADPRASLKKIVIVGLASPEGSLEKNDRLALMRADALKFFVGERVKYNANLFETINGSEDWEGLRRLVEASRMPDRWLVLETINKYTVKGGREVELMKLKGGNPYRYLMENFFPKLRNAGYVQIYYDYDAAPDSEADHMNRGTELMNQSQYADALLELLQVVDQERVTNAIGVCYLMTGRYDLADSYLQRAAEQGDLRAKENLEQLRQKRETIRN